MPAYTREQLLTICQGFQIDGTLTEIAPHGSGHINDTYLGSYRTSNGQTRFIHQRINQNVFKRPDWVMENIERVTRHARQKILEAGGDPVRETLTLVPAKDGRNHVISEDGSTWRTYVHIDGGARTYEVAENLSQVTSAARAFGKFQHLLADLSGERLHETIPGFHHTRRRFEAFQKAVREDPAGRVAGVQAEIDFVLAREVDASVVVDLLADGRLPERVTHNDTKLNNVLIDERSGEGVCVLDLDTVMPGSVLYDFGDLVRTGTATAAEDERDLELVHVDMHLFERLAAGYAESARGFLIDLEWELLAFSGKLITYEQAIRFLGDHINGDTYYKIHHPNHNLQRARTQIKMVSEMERQMAQMQAVIQQHRQR